ncbi:DUF294 nucleotidyltransferase-like domain-containing protein [Shewanella intestini]|uniref:Cyclic nucleotide-binding/CBS domain-containing protein n=1 Tax=Shewanella intestini TaxID=2017544 RepID=A0ABS5I5N0_9GAMM|nr:MULTISPECIES: DUF294 nucleotidyltransferase-like domain-containing protein [Shewanella]MBR9729216.1 cyclic nucleotide-binding/CBS domain-containing protein [Shewanella intestini]MRG35361.1 CBS domain-containing protein [Shewanella sp. XMDDZSB0408]
MDETEILPVVQFIKALAPFDRLSEADLLQTCQSLTVGYYSKSLGELLLDHDNLQLYIVRTGAFEVKGSQGELIDRLGEGDYFGFPSLLSGDEISNQVIILEDSLVYHLSASTFDSLRQRYKEFDQFFNRAYAKRMRQLSSFGAVANEALASTSHIHHLMSPQPVSININEPIQRAAQIMQQHNVSSILVIDNQKLSGIITDKDLRNRVLAQGIDVELPVHKVMTGQPMTISADTLVFDAMLAMSEKDIHHLAVVNDGIPIGVLTSSDILRAQSSEPQLLINQLNRQTTVAGLIQVSHQIPQLFQHLVHADHRAHDVGRILTSVTDVLTRRLIEINQQLLGAAPIAFCWLAFGSQARQDQMGCSDQDNGLLLACEPNEAEAAYFANLTKAVCKGLNECGYVFCPGNIMAQNPKWRLSLEKWQQCFHSWVKAPEPLALMHASIFFDMRCIYGPQTLFSQLQQHVLTATKNNDIFLAAMTNNALTESTPLGFFRKFVVERDGSEVKGIDLKHKGSALVNDIARIYALSVGLEEVNTAKRIQALIETKILNPKDGSNLADAHEFIAHLRLSNQGYQAQHGVSMSNFLIPQHLSSLIRHQLRAAFHVVHDAQSGLKLQFTRSF